jgi:hypothetical protein
MPRALLALCAICGALALPAAASAGAVVIKDYDVGMSVQTYPFNPCTGTEDPSLTVSFLGATSVHVTARMQDGIFTSARVDVDQSGGIMTNIGGIDYYGFLSYGSKLNLNQQNQVASVTFSVAAVSLDFTSSLAFQVTERVTLSASGIAPVAGSTTIAVASCPA